MMRTAAVDVYETECARMKMSAAPTQDGGMLRWVVPVFTLLCF